MCEASGGKVELRLPSGLLPARKALGMMVRALHAPSSSWDTELPIEVLAEVIELARGFLVPGEEPCPMETAVLEPASRAFASTAVRAAVNAASSEQGLCTPEDHQNLSVWCAMLQSSQLALEVPAKRPIDQLVRDACAKAVAQSAQFWAKEWQRASRPPIWTSWLASLSLPSLLIVQDHLPSEHIALPILDTDALTLRERKGAFAAASETASWLADATLHLSLTVHPRSGRLLCYICKSGRDHNTAEYLVAAEAELTLDPGEASERKLKRLCAVPQHYGGGRVLRSASLGKMKDREDEDARKAEFTWDKELGTGNGATGTGRIRVAAEVVVPAELRRYELFALWLLARGEHSAVSLPQAIGHLRWQACGFPEAAGEEEAALKKLDQLSVAPPPDAASGLPEVVAASEMCDRFISFAAASFGRAPASWATLDAASFTRLLEHPQLQVKDERAVLEATLKWSLQPGRCRESIDQLVPLVRFPLVPLVPISDEVKALVQLSPVAKEVVGEALSLQLGKTTAEPFRPKRHRLHGHDEPIEVKRHQPRNLCKGDHIQRFNLVDSLLQDFG